MILYVKKKAYWTKIGVYENYYKMSINNYISVSDDYYKNISNKSEFDCISIDSTFIRDIN